METNFVYQEHEEKSAQKEASLKTSKKTAKKEHKISNNLDIELDDEEDKIVKNPKRGSGKYKGNPLFKFFIYEKLGHYETKCSYTKIGKSNEKDDSRFKNYKHDKTEKRGQACKQRKNLYNNEDISSSGKNES